MVIPLIADFLMHIFNFIISSSDFPYQWKHSKIIPIPKVLQPLDVSNFRPISILPSLSKVLEKIIFNQINEYLEENNMHNKFQSGFRGNYSTTTALLKISDDIRTNMNSKRLTFLVLLDLSRAFDSICYLESLE